MHRIAATCRVMLMATIMHSSAVAQVVPGSELCSDATILGGLQRARGLPNAPPLLFDGREPLKNQPILPLKIDSSLLNILPACALLSVTFTERGGAVYVDQSGPIAMTGRNRAAVSRSGSALYQAATQSLREIVRQELLPTRPRPGVRYLVLLPLDGAHPLYRPAATTTQRSEQRTLADRGYRDARFVAESDGVQAYWLAEAGDRYWFALVRSVRNDEPLLDYAEASGSAPGVALGERSRQRLQRLIVPYIRDTGRNVTVEVRHYAAGTKIEYRPDSPYANNELRTHPTAGYEVEIPVAVERWTATRRRANEPLSWSTTGPWGTQFSELNTIGAIQATQHAIGTRMAANAAARERRNAEEIVRVRAQRTRMEERERTKPARYAANGLTYRPASEWAPYTMGRALRAVYEGHYPDARRDWIFGRVYFHAVATYGDACRALLPAGSAKRTTTWYDDNPYVGKTPFRIEEIYIHRDYVRVFESWHDARPDLLPLNPDEINAAVDLGRITDPSVIGPAMSAGLEVARVKKALQSDMNKLFELPCKSSAIVQFMENLRRLADGEPTLQEQRIPDTLPRPDDAPATIVDACNKYDRDNAHPRNTKFCACLDRQLTPLYTPAELSRQLENYSALIERASYPPNGDFRAVPAREYAAADACRQR